MSVWKFACRKRIELEMCAKCPPSLTIPAKMFHFQFSFFVSLNCCKKTQFKLRRKIAENSIWMGKLSFINLYSFNVWDLLQTFESGNFLHNKYRNLHLGNELSWKREENFIAKTKVSFRSAWKVQYATSSASPSKIDKTAYFYKIVHLCIKVSCSSTNWAKLA